MGFDDIAQGTLDVVFNSIGLHYGAARRAFKRQDDYPRILQVGLIEI
jgi:hypothetical protein